MTALENAYNGLFIGAIIILAVFIICALIRAVIGPKIADRIMAINMIGTMTIMIISILAVKLGETYLEDISVIYAMISFLAVVILSKVYMGVHRENISRCENLSHRENPSRRENPSPCENASKKEADN